jgi:hypothetical protein
MEGSSHYCPSCQCGTFKLAIVLWAADAPSFHEIKPRAAEPQSRAFFLDTLQPETRACFIETLAEA